MRIIMLLTNPFKPDPRVYEEARALVNFGYDVTILAWDREKKYEITEELDGIRIRRIRCSGEYGKPLSFLRGFIAYYIKALKEIRKEKYDFVHSHDFDTLPMGFLVKKLKNAKLVYDAHDHYSSMIRDVVPSTIADFVRIVERFLIKRTDARIAATNELGKMLFSPLPFTTIMNAKRLSEYNIEKNKVLELKTQLAPGGEFLIVYIGILKIWTPLPTIIEAVKNREGIKLIIGGDGPHKKEILDMINGSENIGYIGWINKKAVPLYTLASDIIILPSNPNKEYTRVAVPNKLLEALAAGKPIIAGKDTAGENIVKECKCGYLCYFGDHDCIIRHLEILIKDKSKYRELSMNAKRCAEQKYNWKNMEKKLISLYKELS